MKLRIAEVRTILREARLGKIHTFSRLLNEDGEGDSQSHVEGASGESLDAQVDKYLVEYESDAKKSSDETGGPLSTDQMESIDWRDLIRGVITEAGEPDKDDATDPDDAAPGAAELTNDDSGSFGLDHIDVEKFANDVVRLVDNYDSLLEVRNTIVRRAKAFIKKNYDKEVQTSFDDVLRDDHGIEPGYDKGQLDAEKYPAPVADRANGNAESSGGGM
jgi:hypothetical protein